MTPRSNIDFHADGKKTYLNQLYLQQFAAWIKIKSDPTLTPQQKRRAKHDVIIKYKDTRKAVGYLLF